MQNGNESKSSWNGWRFRYVGMTVLVIVVLQVVADYAIHYKLVTTIPLGVLFAAYVIIPRIKERRLGNALLGALAVWVIDVILEVFIDFHGNELAAANRSAFLQYNLYALALGVVVCWGYLKLTEWSERKRAQMEAKRQAETQPAQPVRRHHKKKKRRK
ncbi:hypothetical protein JI721_15275 [Alicyclobacillus cycloheptanicus]|uniref:Uncharacterized protein n=1 Tax=Alicyclobacillus cycloheptanicus TaxID=1457 RepID=A0ABT9XEQ4_9BACL|nr:hypothetical protein [Alicyclobacillus cycloheptanicus]MDQ0188298.1 hypothetical protein [Alicyclobacillus cycloheptanicus]WDM01014.1 hypothetical protein JI721_15275 [Alicyclobacillus cycloheptanicus]